MAKQKSFIDELISKYGEEVLGKEFENGHPSISTGSLAIDVSTGIGGIPVGRYTEIYGPEAGGKTTLSLSICRQAVEIGIKCLYVDVENSLDLSYAKTILGDYYDEDSIVFVQPNSAEDAFDLAEMGIDAGFRCIVFDSIASISPEEEVEKDYGKQSIALSPRLTNQFLKKTRNKILSKGVAFIFTNQVRANIGSYMGGYIVPGGYALKHYTSLRLYVSKGQSIDNSDKSIGNAVTFVVKKNKMAVPFRTAETNIIYGVGIDYFRDVIKFASMLGVVTARGPYLYFDDSSLGQGLAKSIEYLTEHPETLDKIVEGCYNIASVKYPPIRPEQKGEDVDEG